MKAFERAFLVLLVAFALWHVEVGYAETPTCDTTLPLDSIGVNFHHASWASKDGAPAGIVTIAQTPSGWLWVGSNAGLFRFDGVHFERVDLHPPQSTASHSVVRLYVNRGGDLWVAYSFGGADQLAGDTGHITHTREDAEGGTIIDFAQSAGGDTWVATTKQNIYRLENGNWVTPTAEWGLQGRHVAHITADSQGRLWASSDLGLYVLPVGGRKFVRADQSPPDDFGIFEGQQGQLIAVSKKFDYREFEAPMSTRSPANRLLLSPTSNAAVSARDGSIWSRACTVGVCRMSNPDLRTGVTMAEVSRDTFTRADGLSSDFVLTLFEDAEGSIWVGTTKGLDQFRKNDIRVLRSSGFISFSLATDASGALWIATADYPCALWTLGSTALVSSGRARFVQSLYAEKDGSLLIGESDGLVRQQHNVSVPFKPAAPTAFDRGGINAIARDQDGRLWISARHLGVFRLDGAQWLEKGGIAALPNLYANLIVTDTTGKVWLGYSDGRLAAVANGKATIYGEAEGLRTGSVTAILPGRALLVGGDLGLYAFHEGSFQRIKTTDGRLLDGITGMTLGRDDALWVNAVGGAMRIQWRDIQRALDSPDYEVPVRLFDANDGMSGGAQQIQPLHTAVEDAEGTIWFATTDGLASIDPLKLQHNSIAPKVEIQSMVTPERTYSPNTRLVFPAHTRDVTFNFTALSLAVPERVRFRVRLYGVDSRWHDIDGRRSISYSNLAPGSYTFGVAASNNDGMWSHDAATASFSITPAPYQTTTFKVFLGLAIGLALWVISQLYVRRAVARVTTRMKERIYERERIARDLHDTLLQDIEALVVNLQVLGRDQFEPGRTQVELQGLTDEARKALLKARNRVAGLREGSGDAGRIVDALQEMGERLRLLYPARYDLKVVGAPRALKALADEEINSIAREAMLNAFRHASASEVEVTLVYKSSGISVSIKDNGSGIDPEVLREGRREGHWGLVGMRERATRLGSHLQVTTAPRIGTHISLKVRSTIAYARESRKVIRPAQDGENSSGNE
jgi:signal transduction histidine kinase/ligand-binding sensor domain-containing protein